MSLYEFKKNEVVKNTLITHPKINFKIFKNDIYYNNLRLSQDILDGYVHIYDLNLSPINCSVDIALKFVCPDPSFYFGVI